MRSSGVAEKFCTGKAQPYEKFLAFAETLPHTLRNPLFHWSALELKRYFGINTLLTPATAPGIWKKANARLAKSDRSVQGILRDFKVEVICTTDDPADSLEHHAAYRKQKGGGTAMYPTFRPDALLKIDQTDIFNKYVERLGAAAEVEVGSLAGLMEAFQKRHDFFHAMGCRLSDHGLGQVPASFASEKVVAGIYAKARRGKAVTAEEQQEFATYIMLWAGRLGAARGWTMQLHLGPQRNNNSRAFQKLGPDSGFDSIGVSVNGARLAAFLDALEAEDKLPKTILYNLNPADNYVMATMCGNFMDGKTAGKVQFGPGWWFLDQKEGMQWQMNALSNLGLLSHWVGMLTDSRSFMSFSRHEYFRRILCDLLAEDAKRGEVPDDFDLLADYVARICYGNARNFFGFPNFKK